MADKAMKKDIKKVLISKRKLKKIVKRLGRQISEDYKGKPLMLVGILKGSIISISDIMREITIPCRIDLMIVSAYKDDTVVGSVEIIQDIMTDIKNFDVVIIEDIIDTGKTLSCVKKMLLEREPKSLKICTLLDKPSRRETELEADYVGTVVPDEFVVGYGLDYAERYRNLPYIGVLKEKIYSEKPANKEMKDVKEL